MEALRKCITTAALDGKHTTRLLDLSGQEMAYLRRGIRYRVDNRDLLSLLRAPRIFVPTFRSILGVFIVSCPSPAIQETLIDQARTTVRTFLRGWLREEEEDRVLALASPWKATRPQHHDEVRACWGTPKGLFSNQTWRAPCLRKVQNSKRLNATSKIQNPFKMQKRLTSFAHRVFAIRKHPEGQISQPCKAMQ